MIDRNGAAVSVGGSCHRWVRRGRGFGLALVVLLLVGVGAGVQAQRPDEIFRPGGRAPVLIADEGGRGQPLGLAKLAAAARIVGGLAETRLTMTFTNPHDRALAGDLYFPLPEGVTVSGYALDVNGQMVDGVAVPKEKARQVFETEMRKGVDPGLVEWVAGNSFKTRVFPIPARGSRTVMVAYTSEIVESASGTFYHLPLAIGAKIPQFELQVEVARGAEPPRLVVGGLLEKMDFGRWQDGFRAQVKLADFTPDRDLMLELPASIAAAPMIEQAADGNHWFAVSVKTPADPRPASARGGFRPRRLVLAWDASNSRAKLDHAREFAFIKAWFAAQADRVVEVDLVLFRNVMEEPKRFTISGGDASALLADLAKVDYDGGTSLGALKPLPGAAPDAWFVFTDGVSNLGRAEPAKLGCALYSFSAAATTNHAVLRQISLAAGGDYFNLVRFTDAQVIDRLGESPFVYLGVEAEGAVVADVLPSLPSPAAGRIAVAGRLAGERATLRVQFGANGKVLATEKVELNRQEAVRGGLLRRFWAQQRLAELLLDPKKNDEAIGELGRRFALVTPNTSLMVLESLEQYLQHEIEPPETLPAVRQQYLARIDQRIRERAREREQKIAVVLQWWQQRVAWWERDFNVGKDFRIAGRGRDADGMANESDAAGAGGSGAAPGGMAVREESRSRMLAPAPRPTMGAPGAPPPPPALRRLQAVPDTAAAVDAELSAADAGVAGPADAFADKASAGAGRDARAQAMAQPAIAIKAWDPATPYLAVLKNTEENQLYRKYLELKAEHGNAPAFFLDCADFFLRGKQRDLALRILTNVAELELENAALLRILAHRLDQIGELELASMMFEQVLKLRPEEPQSYRDLALVLSRRGNHERAIELLMKVVLGNWPRFAEIETIALMELNNIITKARAAGLTAFPDVDPRLIKPLDLDVRIVMTWDTDMTDMDLWVTEPSGEKAMYNHPRTRMGGLVSRDFTQGYGPEEYCLKKSIPGLFKIESNYYGSSAVSSVGGPTTVQVEVFTNYGRPNEQRKTLTLRLNQGREVVTVGEIEF